MNQNNIESITFKVTGVLVFWAIAGCPQGAVADLIPPKILLSYAAPGEICEGSIRAEDRRHDIQLLRFRQQQRAVSEKYQEDMIDCASRFADTDCPIRASRKQQAGLNAIYKKQAQEDKVHLDKLDEITTLCAQGKYPPRR